MISRKWVNKRIESFDCRFDWEENQLVDDSRVMLIKAGKLDYFESFVTGKYKKGDINFEFIKLETFIAKYDIIEGDCIKVRDFGISETLLDIAISILSEMDKIDIGIPETEAPFIIRDNFMTIYIAPRVYEKKFEEVVQ